MEICKKGGYRFVSGSQGVSSQLEILPMTRPNQVVDMARLSGARAFGNIDMPQGY